MNKLLTINEAAEYLGVSYRTVFRLIHSGQMPASKVGGQWRLEQDAIDLYLKKKSYFVGDIAIHQLYFRTSVLDTYRKEPDKYYIQESGYHGRLGKKIDNYKLHSDRSNAWVIGAKTEELGILPGEFPELNFWKAKLKSGDFAIVVDPKAFYKMPDEEQKKWRPYSILNPSI